MNMAMYKATTQFGLRITALVLGMFLTASAFGQGLPADIDGGDTRRAKDLLARAVAYYTEEGDVALAAISRQGRFTDGELYVYVIDTNGVMLASGGPSATLIGRDVSKTLGPELREEFQQALERPASGDVHHATYRWQNWSSGRHEKKSVFYTRVDNKVFAVGYYIPRSSESEAKNLLTRVVQAMGEKPEETIGKINNLSPEFRQDDLYAFVIDRDSERFIAHGYNRRLVGSDFNTIRSTDKQPIGERMLEMAETSDSGRLSYLWPNPTTNSNEQKITLFSVTEKYIVAVGYYQGWAELD